MESGELTAQQIIESRTPLEVPALDEMGTLAQRVLLFASLGSTTKEAASLAGARRRIVEHTRDKLIEAYDVPNMAAVVNAAIFHSQIPLEISKYSRVANRLMPRQKLALGYTAIGLTKSGIAAELGNNPETFHSNVLRPTFKVLEASGRTHSVRRSYELGVFKVLKS